MDATDIIGQGAFCDITTSTSKIKKKNGVNGEKKKFDDTLDRELTDMFYLPSREHAYIIV